MVLLQSVFSNVFAFLPSQRSVGVYVNESPAPHKQLVCVYTQTMWTHMSLYQYDVSLTLSGCMCTYLRPNDGFSFSCIWLFVHNIQYLDIVLPWPIAASVCIFAVSLFLCCCFEMAGMSYVYSHHF